MASAEQKIVDLIKTMTARELDALAMHLSDHSSNTGEGWDMNHIRDTLLTWCCSKIIK